MSTQQGLATIGISIKVNSVPLNYVTDFSDIGGTPSVLESTCFKDNIKKSVPGVQDAKAFEVTYLFDNTDATSDFRKLKTLQDAGAAVPVVVEFGDKPNASGSGTKFSTTGYVSTYIVGAKVDELISAKLVVNLQSEWAKTDPVSGN